MQNLAGSVAVVALFAILVHLFKIVPRARDVMAQSRRALATMTDANLTDDDKEAALQKNAVRLLVLACQLTVGGALALAIPVGAVWVLQTVGYLSLDTVLAILVRWDFIVAATGAWLGLYLLRRSLRR